MDNQFFLIVKNFETKEVNAYSIVFSEFNKCKVQ